MKSIVNDELEMSGGPSSSLIKPFSKTTIKITVCQNKVNMAAVRPIGLLLVASLVGTVEEWFHYTLFYVVMLFPASLVSLWACL